MSNAARQRRWRAKRAALVKAEVTERELIAAAERCERLCYGERIALADQLADWAMGHLRRAQEFAAMARRVRTGEPVCVPKKSK